jgi:hypothetical protein
MSHGIHESEGQIEHLRQCYTRFVNDDCSRRLGSGEGRLQKQDFHHFSTDSCRGRYLIDGATSESYAIQLPQSQAVLIPLKTGCPASGMEQVRDDLKQKKGDEPEAHNLEAREQVSDADLSDHPAE